MAQDAYGPRRAAGRLRTLAVSLVVPMLLAGMTSCAGAPAPEPSSMFGFSVSEYEAEVLADDVVTDAEYEAAWRAHYECVQSEGIDVGPLERSLDGVNWEFSFSMPNGEDPVAGPTSQAYLRCENQYLSVLMIWKYNEAIPSGAERDSAWRDLLRCLDEVGLGGVTPEIEAVELYGRINTELADDAESWQRATACVERSYLFAEPAPVDQ